MPALTPGRASPTGHLQLRSVRASRGCFQAFRAVPGPQPFFGLVDIGPVCLRPAAATGRLRSSKALLDAVQESQKEVGG